MSVRVEEVLLGGDPQRWASLGFTVVDEGRIPLLGTSLRIVESSTGGVVGWRLSGVDDVPDGIDGLATEVVPAGRPQLVEHENGCLSIDHVVVLTSSIDRTSAAVEAVTGAPLKRIREVGSMRQGFHRIGSGGMILELVERPEFDQDHAVFWGIAVNVADLDATARLLGPDRLGTPKDAVQPGRRIATVRSQIGLGAPVAMMSLSEPG